MGLPMRRLPSLAGLRAFEAAARLSSFKRAAEELHVTPTAISHQVRQLEAAIGAPLFERRTRQVVLTPEGHVLLPVLSTGFDNFARAIDGLRRRRRSGGRSRVAHEAGRADNGGRCTRGAAAAWRRACSERSRLAR